MSGEFVIYRVMALGEASDAALTSKMTSKIDVKREAVLFKCLENVFLINCCCLSANVVFTLTFATSGTQELRNQSRIWHKRNFYFCCIGMWYMRHFFME